MWGNLKCWHDHDKFHKFTKSLKITYCGSEDISPILAFSKKIRSNNPILFDKKVQEFGSQQPLCKCCPTFTYSVNIFTKFTEYIQYRVKEKLDFCIKCYSVDITTIIFHLLHYLFQSIMSYNGAAVVAMKGKDCVAIASDRRFGIQAQTVAMDFQKVFEMGPHLYLGLPGLATDVQTV